MASELDSTPKVFQHMLGCKQCRLHKNRRNVVVGRGNYRNSSVMIVGEGPGEEEDRTGKPFVGRAGERLNEFLSGAGLADIYICNIVKCRPTSDGKNRAPSSLEVRKCSLHMDLKIRVVRPKIIVVLGNVALQYFCPGKKILSCHGQEFNSKKCFATIFPIIHPAAGLRRPEWNDLIQKDFDLLKSLVSTTPESKAVFGSVMIG